MSSAGSTKKPKPMTKKQLQHFEKRLLEERKRILKELGHYDETCGATAQQADGDLSSYSFHMADQGTDALPRPSDPVARGEAAATFCSRREM